MQTVYFYFDDSGTFHKNEPSGYFLYAGYVFCNVNDRDIAKRKYINLTPIKRFAKRQAKQVS